ncbi:DUF4422 domain-containing protein [Paracoccus sp. M683]|nr:DUF4422 domain-containing protein [Paracoccus sp. M683]TRW92926.1 DUF4422 domain-containing protein [Paracoccus sp. M683]
MISIYVNYFASAKLLESNIIKPIQVGAANSKQDLGILRDDSGENISVRNPAYCEMTGIYWAWKNDSQSDVLGFLHYRRYFDFRPDQRRKLNPHGMIDHPTMDRKLISEYGLSDDVIEQVMAGLDMAIPEPFDVRSTGPRTVRQHYETAIHHHIEDLELAGRIVDEISPQYAPYFEAAMSGHILYPNNMFLFRRPIFEEFCTWIFPILERLDAEIDTGSYNWQEARAVGYIAERLFTAFILGQKGMNPALKVKELRRVFVASTVPDPSEPPMPETDLPIITVVASSDAAYVPHLGTLISSTFKSTTPDVFIDFIVLDGGITPGQRRLLNRMAALREQASLSFIDMRFQHLNIPVHSYFARATFFRLSLPELLESRDRIIFLDTDMVVVDDLNELNKIELDGALIAAAPDLVMRAFARMMVPSIDTTGSLPAEKYVSEYLGLKKNGTSAFESYFQAGTLVMDLDGLRRSGLLREAVEDLAARVYWFLDQDILNKYLFGKVKFIDNRWNALWMDDVHAESLKPEDNLPYRASLDNPAVIHFAGAGKPWLNAANPLSHYYWEFLRETPWYETLLFSFLDNRYARPSTVPVPQPFVRQALRRVGTSVWHTLPPRLKATIWPFALRVKRAIG